MGGGPPPSDWTVDFEKRDETAAAVIRHSFLPSEKETNTRTRRREKRKGQKPKPEEEKQRTALFEPLINTHLIATPALPFSLHIFWRSPPILQAPLLSYLLERERERERELSGQPTATDGRVLPSGKFLHCRCSTKAWAATPAATSRSSARVYGLLRKTRSSSATSPSLVTAAGAPFPSSQVSFPLPSLTPIPEFQEKNSVNQKLLSLSQDSRGAARAAACAG